MLFKSSTGGVWISNGAAQLISPSSGNIFNIINTLVRLQESYLSFSTPWVSSYQHVSLSSTPSLLINHHQKLICFLFQYSSLIFTRGLLNFFWWVCATRFPKVQSWEKVFLELWGVLGAEIQKFCILRAEILAKNMAENANFSKSWKWGSHERHIDGKLVGLGASTGLKKGGHDRSTYQYPLSTSVPPPRLFYTTYMKCYFAHFINLLAILSAKCARINIFAKKVHFSH